MDRENSKADEMLAETILDIANEDATAVVISLVAARHTAQKAHASASDQEVKQRWETIIVQLELLEGAVRHYNVHGLRDPEKERPTYSVAHSYRAKGSL